MTYQSVSGYSTEYVPHEFLSRARYSRVLVPERVRKSVGFIGYRDKDSGEFVPCGTAFFLSCVTDGFRFSNLVTAQHVIIKIQAKSDEVAFRFNSRSGRFTHGTIPSSGWYFHPDATRYVDVAVTPVNMPYIADIEHLAMDLEAATESVIAAENIGPGEEVFVSGFFRYHYGATKNIPIVRVGNIAAMPEEPIETKSGPIDGYLIESRSIGGLSGSPVFVHLAPWRIVNRDVVRTEKAQYYLLGLMHGHYEDKAVKPSALDDDEKLNVGIGIVIPMQDIMETIMQPDLEDQRKEIVAKKQAEGANVVADVADDEGGGENRGDAVLETMLNTPPKPRDEK